MQALSGCPAPCCPIRLPCSPGSENTVYQKKRSKFDLQSAVRVAQEYLSHTREDKNLAVAQSMRLSASEGPSWQLRPRVFLEIFWSSVPKEYGSNIREGLGNERKRIDDFANEQKGQASNTVKSFPSSTSIYLTSHQKVLPTFMVGLPHQLRQSRQLPTCMPKGQPNIENPLLRLSFQVILCEVGK